LVVVLLLDMVLHMVLDMVPLVELLVALVPVVFPCLHALLSPHAGDACNTTSTDGTNGSNLGECL
jgi:hypothetical protein